MNMRTSIFASFTVAALAALLLTGCERAVNMTGKPVEFSAGISDGRSESETRVVYGEISGEGTSKKQPLEWVVDDHITISCAQCESKTISDYKVTGVTGPDEDLKSYASIVNAETDGIGLRWGTGSHTFYAVYPKADGTGTTINGKDINGVIPATQGFTEVSGTDDQIVAPDMNNMYMVSKAGTYEPDASPVTLVFKPLSTALEFTITNKFEDTESAMIVNSISLVSTGHALSGGFAVDMDDTNGGDGYHHGRPKTTLAGGTTAADNNTVTIDFGDAPVTVAYCKTLNFTFFLNPGNEDEVDDLTFVISGTNSFDNSPFTRRAKLEYKTGDGVTIPTHQKTRISGLMVPEGIGWIFDPTVQSWNQSSTGIDPMPETDGTPFVTSWDTDIDDELTLTDPYNGHEYVEIGGYKWATCNIGATSPKEYGWYFFWAGTTGYVWDSANSKWVTEQGGSELPGGFSWANTPFHNGIVYNKDWYKYIPSGKGPYWIAGGSPDDLDLLELDDDAARANWGGIWRMPEQKEFQDLYEACGGTGSPKKPDPLPSANPPKGIYWVDAGQNYISDYTGAAGILFCDGENSLFFVAAGYGQDAKYNGAGTDGRYWLSTLHKADPSYAYRLGFREGDASVNNINYRNLGFAVRPVSD